MWTRLRYWLNDIHLRDPIEQQQAPSLQIFMLVVAIAATLWIALPLYTAGTAVGLAFGIAAPLLVIVCNIWGVIVLRRGQFERAVLISVSALTTGVTLVLAAWGIRTGGGMLVAFTMGITLAGLLTNRRSLILIATTCMLVVVVFTGADYILPGLLGFAPLQGDPAILSSGTFVLATCVMLALLMQFGTSLRQVLTLSLVREQELERLRDSLEMTVAERTASLQEALHGVEQRETQLTRTLDDLRASQDTIRELSAPVIPVLPGVLVAPLVGALDGKRAAILTENILRAVEHSGAHAVIFDITGVPIVDTQVALVLVQTAEAIRLLGADVLLVGVRPEVAQTIVSLNVTLGPVVTYPDLQEAVKTLIQGDHWRDHSNGRARR
jgi:rsbT co-antagonist protein RsbR